MQQQQLIPAGQILQLPAVRLQQPVHRKAATVGKQQTLLQRPLLQRAPQQQQREVLPLPSLSTLHPDLQQLVQQRQQQQQQQQQPQQVDLLPHPMCELAPATLTARIKNCRTWHDAAVLFAQQAPCLNQINTSALLVKLAHLPGPPSSRPANWEPFVRHVLATSQPLLQFAQPRQLSNMAWALAKLELQDWAEATCAFGTNSSCSVLDGDDGSGFAPGWWGSAWQQQVLSSLHSASCRDVSNILWALATAASNSSSSSRDRSLSGVASAHQHMPQQQQQQQLQVGHVLSRSRLVEELLSALHRTLPSSTPQDVANAVWALATLRIQPSSELLSFMLIRLQSHFADLKPREVSTTLWALSQLQAAPPSSWLQECLLRQVRRQQWQHTQVRPWVMCLTACAHMQQVPPTAWLTECLSKLQLDLAETAQQHPATNEQQQLQQQQQHLGAPPTAQGAQQVDASDASHHLADSVLAIVQQRDRTSSSSTGSSSNAHAVSSNMCSANATTGSRGSSISGGGVPSTAARHTLSSQDLSNTIWALATLRVKPNADWMGAFMFSSAVSLATAAPQELVNTLWGLQMLRVVPSAPWLAAFDAASMACMPAFTPQGLGDILAAQVRLGLKPSCAWTEAWASALKASWGSADATAVCKILWAAAKCQLPLGRKWLGQALQQVHKPLLLHALVSGELTNEDLLRLMWAVGRLCKGNLSQELSNLLGLYCCRAAGKMTGAQLARGAWGLARLVPLPREGLLSYFHDLAASKLKYLPQAEGAELQGKLLLLKDAAAKAELFGRDWRVVVRRAQEQQQAAHAALHGGCAYPAPDPSDPAPNLGCAEQGHALAV